MKQMGEAYEVSRLWIWNDPCFSSSLGCHSRPWMNKSPILKDNRRSLSDDGALGISCSVLSHQK